MHLWSRRFVRMGGNEIMVRGSAGARTMHCKNSVLFLALDLALLFTAVLGDEKVTVQAPSGPVLGRRTEQRNRQGVLVTVDRFLGVPFALPPTGDRRFQRPQPHPGWSTPIDASQGPPPVCAQIQFRAQPEKELPVSPPSSPPDGVMPPGEGATIEPAAMPPVMPPSMTPSPLPPAMPPVMPSGFPTDIPPTRTILHTTEVPPVRPQNPDSVSPATQNDQLSSRFPLLKERNSTPSPRRRRREAVTVETTKDPTEEGGPFGGATAGQGGPFGGASAGQGGPFGGAPAGAGGPFESAPEGQGGPSEGAPAGQGGPFGGAPAGQGGPFGGAPAGQGGPFGGAPEGQGGPFGGAPAGQGGPFGGAPEGQGGPSEGAPAAQGGPFGSAPSDDSGNTEPVFYEDYVSNSSDWDYFDSQWNAAIFNFTSDFNESFAIPAYGPPLAEPLPPELPQTPRLPPQLPFSPYPKLSEDCLFLNIFVPKITQSDEDAGNTQSPDGISEKLLPVMVFIHGGGFVSGSALDIDPSHMSVETQSIVVTMAYRLGVFGLMTLAKGGSDGISDRNENNYSGNLLFWDQLEALRWVQANIAAFGGDPQQVTLSGFSAGGMSVAMHIISPASAGLFQRAISMSGSLIQMQGSRQISEQSGAELLKRLGCISNGSVASLSTCLSKPTTAQIAQAAQGLDFFPMEDGFFMPGDPVELLSQGRFSKVPYMLGVNSDEGLIWGMPFLAALGDNISSYSIIAGTRERALPQAKHWFRYDELASPSFLKGLWEILKRHYLGADPGEVPVREAFRHFRGSIDIFSDLYFAVPARMAADFISAKVEDVYVYYLDHTPSITKDLYREYLGIDVGAGHVEPLPMFWAIADQYLSPVEMEISNTIINSFKHFIKSGKTNSNQEIQWRKYKADSNNFLCLGGEEGPSMKTGFFDKSTAFWTKVLPAFTKDLNRPCMSLADNEAEGLPEEGNDIISTSQGKLRGLKGLHSERDMEYMTFYGVPYAAPPIGLRRWQPPEQPARWSGVRSASSFAASCPQAAPGTHSEDCLYLNLWVPSGANAAPELPVVVYIHGGKFKAGTGNDPSLVELAVGLQSIVVSVNFRLGALGFLSTENDDYPGNYAHQDIVMALQWVRENIHAFGGDPSRCTLLGVSSGAALVSQLLLSHGSRGLFSFVVALGGSAYAPWAQDDHPLRTVRHLAARVGCPRGNDLSVTIKCLTDKDSADLVQELTPTSDTLLNGFHSPLADFPWRPVRRPKTKNRPQVAYQPCQVPIMVSVAESEGYQMAEFADHADNQTAFFQSLEAFVLKESQDMSSVYEAIKTEYFSRSALRSPEHFKKAVTQLFTDWAFVAPTMVMLNTMAGTQRSAYPIYWRYTPDFSDVPGVARHGDEVSLLKKSMVSSTGEILSPGDWIAKEHLLHRLKQFGISGAPNPWSDFANTYWMPYTKEEPVFLIVSENGDVTYESISLTKNMTSRMRLWVRTIPEIMKQRQNVCPAATRRNKPHHPTNSDVTAEVQPSPSVVPNVNGRAAFNNRQTERGIFALGLMESQITLLVLAGVCILLLIVILVLTVIIRRLKRPTGAEQNGVILAKNPLHATKI